MKAFRKKEMALAAVMICLIACNYHDYNTNNSETETDTYEITLDSDIETNGISLASGAGAKTISFTSANSWTLSIANTTSGSTWCTSSATSGKAGTYTVTFAATANESYDSRSVAVTIKSGTESQTFTITQKCVDALLVTTDKYELGQEGGTISVEVKANIDYRMAISATAEEWITESSSPASGSGIHTFDIDPSEEYEKREGEIYFIGSDKTETVRVYQSGGAILLLSQNEYIVGPDEDTITISIKSNFDYRIQRADTDWIMEGASSHEASSHTQKYIIAANEDYDRRSANIIYYDNDSDLKDTLTIIQAQKDAIILSQKEVETGFGSDTIQVKLNTNVDFDIEMLDADWINQINSTLTLAEHTANFTISENENADSRTARIVFWNMENEVADTLTITQAQKDGILLSQKNVEVDSYGGTIEVKLNAHVDFAIEMADTSWISHTPSTDALTGHTAHFTISGNDDADSRTVKVVFKDNESQTADTLTVVQQGASTDSVMVEKDLCAATIRETGNRAYCSHLLAKALHIDLPS